MSSLLLVSVLFVLYRVLHKQVSNIAHSATLSVYYPIAVVMLAFLASMALMGLIFFVVAGVE
ncbi:MAG: hypothetical protein RL172_3294 [Bacteroidota bacterium]|jgi:hypothetical protein